MNYSRQRELILNIVKGTKGHPTAEWVYRQAKKDIPTIGIATVYRNLNAMVEMGTLRRIPASGGQDRFDGDLHDHYHMECICCGRLTDLKAKKPEDIARLGEMVRRTFGIEDQRADLSSVLLKGLCKECGKEQEYNEEKERSRAN